MGGVGVAVRCGPMPSRLSPPLPSPRSAFAARARGAAALVVLAAGALVAACSDDDANGGAPAVDAGVDAALVAPDATAASDAVAPTEAGPEGGAPADAGGSCHDLAQLGDTVRWFTKTSAAPAALGGTVAQGAYVLTEFSIHTNELPDGTEVSVIGKTTLSLEGTTMNVLLDRSDGVTFRRTETFTTNGVDFATTRTCLSPEVDGGSEPGRAQYTATPAELTLIYPTASGTVVNVYTKR